MASKWKYRLETVSDECTFECYLDKSSVKNKTKTFEWIYEFVSRRYHRGIKVTNRERGSGHAMMLKRIVASSWDTVYKTVSYYLVLTAVNTGPTWSGLSCPLSSVLHVQFEHFMWNKRPFKLYVQSCFWGNWYWKLPGNVCASIVINVINVVHQHWLFVITVNTLFYRWTIADDNYGFGPCHRPPLTYWHSGVEFFLLEVCIKSTLSIILQNKMGYYKTRIQNICHCS